MRKEYLLLTPLSDDDKKAFRTELKRCNIKIKENFDKILTSYFLTEDEVNSLDLGIVKVFRNMIRDGKSLGVAMINSQNPISYNREFYFTEEEYTSLMYRDFSYTKEVAVDIKSYYEMAIHDMIDKVIEEGDFTIEKDNKTYYISQWEAHTYKLLHISRENWSNR